MHFSTPSLMKKSLPNENGAKLKSIISTQHAGSEDNTNVGSVGGAKPLLQSFINQVPRVRHDHIDVERVCSASVTKHIWW